MPTLSRSCSLLGGTPVSCLYLEHHGGAGYKLAVAVGRGVAGVGLEPSVLVGRNRGGRGGAGGGSGGAGGSRRAQGIKASMWGSLIGEGSGCGGSCHWRGWLELGGFEAWSLEQCGLRGGLGLIAMGRGTRGDGVGVKTRLEVAWVGYTSSEKLRCSEAGERG